MTEKMPLHMATWIRPLSDYLTRQDVDPAPLLKASKIDTKQLEGEDARLPFDRMTHFFELAAEAAGDDSLGFHFGQTLITRDAGMIGYVGLSAASLFDALLNLERYRRIYSDAVVIDTSGLSDRSELIWDFHAPGTLKKRQFLEFSVTNLIDSFREMTQGELRIPYLAFPHPRNTNVDEYRRYFGGSIKFGAPRTLIRFSPYDLQMNVRTADSRLHAILQEHCRAVLEAREPEEVSLIQQIERMIVDRLSSNRAKLDVIASELGMSTRTLTRRLHDLDTTFNAIIDGLRQELAQTYLTDSNLSLSEVAYLLGYSEVSAFNHAYKRWTGKTPSALRKSTGR